MRMYACMHAWMDTCMYVYTYMFFICVLIRIYVYTYIRIYVYTYIRMYPTTARHHVNKHEALSDIGMNVPDSRYSSP